ncbi:MAG: dihydroxy-acid dehydratase, partial [Anaerovoracaceae bacterium]
MKTRSKLVTEGVEKAPMRSLFYAMGYTEEELSRPLIAVVSAHSEIVPGHINLDKITDAVKAGVRMAGGTPIMVPAIGVCDGIAMGHIGMKYSLASRELIADSVETMVMAHAFDGAVLVPNCDKIVPGMVMAAVRMNIPAIVCSGGPMMSGLVGGVETSLSKMFEAVGARKAGIIDDEGLLEYEQNKTGAFGRNGTANSMNCSQASHYSSNEASCVSAENNVITAADTAAANLVEKDIKARDIINEKSIRNAIACDMALGCSSNSVLHLLAIAHEAGVEVDLNMFNEISQVTPNLCHLAPAGGTHMHDLDNAGGVPAVMAQLASKGLIDTSLPTVSGKTVGENIKGRVIKDQEAIRPVEEPYSQTGGIAILWGNIAKDGCVVKRSAVAPEMLVHSGPARVFD